MILWNAVGHTAARHTTRLVAGTLLTIAVVLCVPSRTNAQTPFLSSPHYVTTTVTQIYNPSAGHVGVELGLSYQQVIAANDAAVGQVAWYSNNCHQSGINSSCGYGLFIRLDHSNGYKTYYAHLSAAGFALGTTGTAVTRGQYIGTSGTTGWSTGFSGRRSRSNTNEHNQHKKYTR
jgi:hypothetical protein